MTRYEKNFKQMIVELNQTGRSIRGLAKEYGLSEATIYKWKNLYLPNQSTGLTGKEVVELKKENARLKEELEILKKAGSHILSKDLNSLVQFIEKWCKDYTVSLLCRLLEIPRSVYYFYRNKPLTTTQIKNNYLKQKITAIFFEKKQRYGATKIYHVLLKEKIAVSLKHVQKLMRQLNLRSITIRKYKPQRNKQTVTSRVNILNQNFSTKTICEKWVADITYIPTKKNRWCYLSSIMDLHTKKIISYTFSKRMTVDCVIQTLNKAKKHYHIPEGMVLHTDLGSQYTATEVEKWLETNRIRHSYSRKGTPYDNAGIESFHASLKKEEVYTTTYSDFEEAKRALFSYIEGFYNRNRIHSSIG
ncbi:MULTISPECIES: IS3 family transposase, partial [unclassified Enterococcus]|uniref:IS3 family transposase n=1 Tax=unclassified Enterococcus TaxID=2608891 RepID=UPI00247503B3